jgi:hypothetical protein
MKWQRNKNTGEYHAQWRNGRGFTFGAWICPVVVRGYRGYVWSVPGVEDGFQWKLKDAKERAQGCAERWASAAGVC